VTVPVHCLHSIIYNIYLHVYYVLKQYYTYLVITSTLLLIKLAALIATTKVLKKNIGETDTQVISYKMKLAMGYMCRKKVHISKST